MSGLPEGAASSIVPPGTPMEMLALLGIGVAMAGLGGLFFVTTGRRRGAASAAVEPMPAPVPAAAPRFAAQSAPSDEVNVPRWLRASVRAERFEMIDRDVRTTASFVPRRGARFSEPPLDAATRMLVRYERVQVLDQPNEAYGRTLTEVGTNDEVDVLEAQEAWALVQTPSGVTGWLLTMTIARPAGAVSDAGADPESPPRSAPAAPRPTTLRRPRPARRTPRS
jgi:hypothetical protein